MRIYFEYTKEENVRNNHIRICSEVTVPGKNKDKIVCLK